MSKAYSTDRELVAAMLTGDEAAFRSFFDTYFARLYRFAMPRLGSDEDAAKDAVQATLVKAMRNLATYRGEAALFSWLCQICRHQIVDYLRANKRHTENVVPLEDTPEIRSALDSLSAPERESPFQGYSGAETRRLVQSVLDQLPSRYGDVLEWKYIEDRSVAEISDLLGIGHAAAQSLLARARIAFREALETLFGATALDVLAGLRGS